MQSTDRYFISKLDDGVKPVYKIIKAVLIDLTSRLILIHHQDVVHYNSGGQACHSKGSWPCPRQRTLFGMNSVRTELTAEGRVEDGSNEVSRRAVLLFGPFSLCPVP